MKKSGGYRKLNTFTYSSMIQLATRRFCNKFLNKGSNSHFDIHHPIL